MNGELKHIFDASACLTRRQIREYIGGNLSVEERHAADHHLNSCMFCSDAMDAYQAGAKSLAGMEALNNGFLKEYFARHSPQVHLNSMALSAVVPVRKSRSNRKSVLLRPSGIVAAVLLLAGAVWYMEFDGDQFKGGGRDAAAVTSASAAVQAERPPVVKLQQETIIADKPAPSTMPVTEPLKPAATVVAAVPEPPAKKTEDRSEKPLTQKTKAAENTAAKSVASSRSPGVSHHADQKPANPESGAGLLNLSTEERIAPADEKNPQTDQDATMPAKEEAKDDAGSLFQAGKYNAALGSYKKLMNSGDKRTRQDATLMAARCYMNLGQKDNALQLLESLAATGSGPQKRTAKRMLRLMNNEPEE